MDSTAFDIVLMPVVWATMAGIIVGTILLSLMRLIEHVIVALQGARQSHFGTRADAVEWRVRGGLSPKKKNEDLSSIRCAGDMQMQGDDFSRALCS